MLLADLSVTILTLLQLYWISIGALLAVLLILPLSMISPFPAGISALFSREPRRASLARIYALWNSTSLFNIVSRIALFPQHNSRLCLVPPGGHSFFFSFSFFAFKYAITSFCDCRLWPSFVALSITSHSHSILPTERRCGASKCK